MDILFHLPDDDAPVWIAALATALPGARIAQWPQPADARFDYAVVGGPQPEHAPALSRVKAVFNLGAGVNAFWRIPDLPPEVPLIRLEDAGMGEQMAEYATYAALRHYREFPFYAVEQNLGRWTRRERQDKASFRVGLLGIGVLGGRVAAALRSHGFPVCAWSRTPKSIEGVASFAGPEALAAMLPGCRMLIVLLPLTPTTAGLVDRRVLSALPRGAVLVNLARGALVVDEDLLALLDEGHLGGAMLDVFAPEPLPPEHRFWHHPRVEITPHVSGLTQMGPSVAQIAAKIGALERGEAVSGVVDRERRY
jgi:glyoxylate/hydroxypyruvate reductase A